MSKLYEIALDYVGTPHINRGNVKNVGLDCCTLPAHIFKELKGVDIQINFNYSADWFCKYRCEEIMLPYLHKHFVFVDDCKEGDVISFQWGRAKYAHLGVYLGNNKIIHCSADAGTEITNLQNPYFYDAKGRSRISGYWRLKE